MKRYALSVTFALLTLPVAFAQDVNWDVVLNASGGGMCLPLQSATYNGQPADLSKGAGLSMEICPYYYNNSSDSGEIFAQVPMTQPWNPSGDWYQWYVPVSLITRNAPTATNNIWIFSKVDTFKGFTYYLTYYQVWPQTWDGTLTRTLMLHEKCGRWPCKNYVPYATCIQPHNIYACTVSFTDVSDTLELTGTFPVPTPPAS